MRTIDKIITNVNGKYGAPMGRPDVGTRPIYVFRTDPKYYAKYYVKVYDCYVPMSSDGAYDKGGAYWGLGKRLRVSYTKDLSYIHFYRED